MEKVWSNIESVITVAAERIIKEKPRSKIKERSAERKKRISKEKEKIEENFNNRGIKNFYQEAKRDSRGRQKMIFTKDEEGNMLEEAKAIADR
ncbi:hypothetical protein ILUMI_21517 [Ignelater luminosus]|uniref:Uncharacterized protein n=1 Tax=Ignelater luminosus TaxID=2038154 RepID=A0A8K0CG50_IGNLU|nr:hypothetical protein ILUMI_21517 [Ignelater luminosus]